MKRQRGERTFALALIAAAGALPSICAQTGSSMPSVQGSSFTHTQEISSAEPSAPEERQPRRSWNLEPSEKVIAGSQHYLSMDSGFYLDLPQGFNFNSAYYFYQSDASTRTATISAGIGKGWDPFYSAFTYSITPWAGGYKSHALDFNGSGHTASRNFRTQAGVDYTVTYHTQQSYAQVNKVNIRSDTDIRQMTAMLNISQQIYDTKLSVSFGKSSYDHEIPRLANRIRPGSALGGLLQGFPDMEWKIGAYQDLEDWPLRLWATYDHIKLILSGQSQGGASDSYMTGADVYANSFITATLQYNYFAQTDQPPANYYGAMLALKI